MFLYPDKVSSAACNAQSNYEAPSSPKVGTGESGIQTNKQTLQGVSKYGSDSNFYLKTIYCFCIISSSLEARKQAQQIEQEFGTLMQTLSTGWAKLNNKINLLHIWLVLPRRRLPHKKCCYFPQNWWLRDLLLLLFWIRMIQIFMANFKWDGLEQFKPKKWPRGCSEGCLN